MHLEKNILKGKFGKNKELKKEAREEIEEVKEIKKHKSSCECKSCCKKKEMASKMGSKE